MLKVLKLFVVFARAAPSGASGGSSGERAGAHDVCGAAVCRERDPRVPRG